MNECLEELRSLGRNNGRFLLLKDEVRRLGEVLES